MIQDPNPSLWDPKYIAVIISSCIAAFGWLVSSYINTRAFRKAEASKLKDKISTLFESFFEKLEDKIKSRTLSENELDNFITGKLAIIELQLNHLDRKIKIKLVPDEVIMKIRNEPYEYLSVSNGDYKSKLHELKIGTLEIIEENYTTWYFENDKSIPNLLKCNPKG